MIYGTRQFKNGKKHGYLEFRTGKKVTLNSHELAEFESKLRYYILTKSQTDKIAPKV